MAVPNLDRQDAASMGLSRPAPHRGAWHSPLDPFDDDLATDPRVSTTLRRLVRLAAAASDLTARLARSSPEIDPIEWLTSPQDIFGGRTGLEACQEREVFIHATIVNGLDLEPTCFSSASEDLDGTISYPYGGSDSPVDDFAATCDDRAGALYSCLVEGTRASGGPSVQAFFVMVAADERQVRARLAARFGDEMADAATVRIGFDEAGPLSRTLLSRRLARRVARVAADPGSPTAAGFYVHVEEGFAA